MKKCRLLVLGILIIFIEPLWAAPCKKQQELNKKIKKMHERHLQFYVDCKPGCHEALFYAGLGSHKDKKVCDIKRIEVSMPSQSEEFAKGVSFAGAAFSKFFEEIDKQQEINDRLVVVNRERLEDMFTLARNIAFESGRNSERKKYAQSKKNLSPQVGVKNCKLNKYADIFNDDQDDENLNDCMISGSLLEFDIDDHEWSQVTPDGLSIDSI